MAKLNLGCRRVSTVATAPRSDACSAVACYAMIMFWCTSHAMGTFVTSVGGNIHLASAVFRCTMLAGCHYYRRGRQNSSTLTQTVVSSEALLLADQHIIQSEWKVPASIDLILYIVTLVSHRRHKKQWPTQHTYRLKKDLWSMFSPFLSQLTCTYILRVYGPRHDVNQLPTAIRRQRDGHR